MSVPVLFLGADGECVPPLTILDVQFNSKLMQRGMLHFRMLHFLNHEWTQVNANLQGGSSRCDEVIFRLSPRFRLLLNLQEVECRE